MDGVARFIRSGSDTTKVCFGLFGGTGLGRLHVARGLLRGSLLSGFSLALFGVCRGHEFIPRTIE